MERQRNIAVLSALFPDFDLFQSERLLDEYNDDIETVVSLICTNMDTKSLSVDQSESEPIECATKGPQDEDINTPIDLNEPKVTIQGECKEGRVITAAWRYGQGYSPGKEDTVGVYVYNRELNKSFYSSKKVSECLPACTCSFTVWYDGFYEFRYFAEPLKWISGTPDMTPLCRSERILVGSEVSMDATVSKDSVHVQWDNSTSVAGDWIGLYGTSTRSNRKYVEYQYVEPVHLETPLAGMDFRLPFGGGSFEFRYFRAASTSKLSGYFCSGYSNPFQVRCKSGEFSYFQNGMILHVFFAFLSVQPSPKDRIEIEVQGTVIGTVTCGKYKERLEKKNAGIVSVDLQKRCYMDRKSTCKEWTIRFVSGDGKTLATKALSKLRL